MAFLLLHNYTDFIVLIIIVIIKQFVSVFNNISNIPGQNTHSHIAFIC